MAGVEVPSDIKVIRSSRRKRTVQARVEGETVVVRIPAAMSKAEEAEAVDDILAKLAKKTSSTKLSDADLTERAHRLNNRWLEGRGRVGSIRWVSNQNTRWGSCTVASGDIRISDRLRHVPAYVIDAVIVHELVHTFVPGHNAEFYSWADRAPQAEKAKGYLEAYQRWGS